jgi:hypothetical protein
MSAVRDYSITIDGWRTEINKARETGERPGSGGWPPISGDASD